jgi:cytochrome c-type biogenesis protein CcmF
MYNLIIGAVAQRQMSTGDRGRIPAERLADTARRAGMVGFAAVSLAVCALLWAILSNDFSLSYVVNESSRALPGAYKFAALWSGREGSLLLWAWLLTGYSFIVRLRRTADPRLTALASTILAGVEVFFLLLLNLDTLPFTRLAGAIPTDGFGMNPLLQYPEMVIHPPLLYLGYVGFSVPFAFALGALMLRSPAEKWIPITRRWAIVSWLFLTAGVILGMHWAYAVLGWGGYWGWDPVENASLLPWLTGTAFLHSTIMQQRRGMMKIWNVWLIFATFLLCIFGTLLTRTSIVSSVHAFGASSIGIWLWSFLALVLLVCGITFSVRLDQMKAEHPFESLLSTESSFLFNIMVLLAASIAVFCGTLLPVFSEMLVGSKVTVDAPFYNHVVVPIGLFLLLLTGTAPILAGRSAAAKNVRKDFVVPVIVGVLTAVVLLACGIYPWTNQGDLYAVICFSFSAFVLTAIVRTALRGALSTRQQTGRNLCSSMLLFARSNTRRYGAYIVHFGIVLMFIGFAGSAFNRSVERELGVGQAMDLGPYHLVYQGSTQESNANYVAGRLLLDVYRSGKQQFQLMPETRRYQTSQNLQTIVANHTTPLWDLYVVYEGQNQDSGLPIIKAFLNPLVMWIWIGGVIVLLGTLVALTPKLRTRPVATSASKYATVYSEAVG